MARSENSMTYTAGEKFSLKNHLFNATSVSRLAGEIKQVYGGFDDKKFIRDVVGPLSDLELKQRIAHITDCLYTFLPQDYPQALGIILSALPPALDPNKTDDDFGEFIYEPYNTYITRYGIARQDLAMSLDALEQTTQRFSAEFAIRDFIKQHEQVTLKKILQWSKHKNYHVRRLASEGARPNLPWGGKIDIDDDKRIEILNNLYHDPTRYVVRSVANHLNDLSKTNLPFVLQTLERWQKEGKQNDDEFVYLTRHALRTAIKDGSQEVMDFLGYRVNIKHKITNLQYRKQLSVGEVQEFSCDLTAGESGGYLIDYVVHYRTKNGTLSAKTMKLKDIQLKKGVIAHIVKKYRFRQASTRTLYAGEHAIEIQINGKKVTQFSFDLVK